MDPLSIAAAVVGIAGFGLQVHQALFAFVTNVSNADQCVQALMTDINLTVSALRSIHELLKDEEGLQQTSRGRRLFSDDGLADTKRTAEQCMVIFRSIVAFILKKGKKGKYEVATNDQDPNYLRLNRTDILSNLEKINWAVAQAQVDLYTARLVTFKVSLLLIFSVISLRAQHQDLNNNDIISHIDDLAKAKAAARRRWVILQAAVLREESPPVEPSQLPVPTNNHTMKPQHPTEASASLSSHDHDAPEASTPAGNKSSPDHVVPADGDMDSSRIAEPPSNIPQVDGDKAVPRRPSEVDAEQAGATVPDTAPAAPEPPLKNVTPIDHNINPRPPQGPAAMVIGSEPTLSGSRKDSQHSALQYVSSNGPNRLNLATKEFDSLDAYLYKHGIVRKLQYTEIHIDGLTQHILSHGSSQWWKIFSSLSEEEYEGVEEAMASRRTSGTRALVGIQLINARYKVVLRALLRLISLGTLDHRTLPTRALLIIIGNREADDVDASETRSDDTWASFRRGDRTHIARSWTTRQRSPEMTRSAAARPQAHAQKQQAHDRDGGSPVARMFRRQSHKAPPSSPPDPVRYPRFRQATNVPLHPSHADHLSFAPHPPFAHHPPFAPHSSAHPSFAHPLFAPPPPPHPTFYPMPRIQPVIRPFPPPSAMVERFEELHPGTPSGPGVVEFKEYKPHAHVQPRDPPPKPGPRQKDKEEAKDKENKENQMNPNEEDDSLSDDDSLYASSLVFNQDTVTDAARNRVQELLARWTAPEHNPSTSRGGEGDDVNLKEAARPDAPPGAGRGMAGSMHPNREDQNEEHKSVPAPTVSQAPPEQATPEEVAPEQDPRSKPRRASTPRASTPEQATPEQA